MRSSNRVLAYALWVAGLALFVAIIGYEGFADVMAALALAGVTGLLVVSLYHVVPLAADTVAWLNLLRTTPRPSMSRALWARWIGEAVNTLLPVARVGGEVVRARLVTRWGVAGPLAGAGVVVDVTLGVLTQIVFTLLGVALLLDYVGSAGAVAGLLAALGVFGVLVAIFYVVQRRGLFGILARILSFVTRGRRWPRLSNDAAALDEAVRALYRERMTLAACSGWRLLGWLLGAGEVWLALYFLGHPVSLLEALFLESLGQAVRGLGFAIPGALGVQEGGFVLLGTFVGLAPETALALSLIKRIRELLLGLPGLVAWQVAEGRRFWRRRAEEP